MSTADWWARKLAAEPTRPTRYVQPEPQQRPSALAPQAPAAPVQPGTKAPKHLKASGTCPGCGGDNYFVAPHHTLSGVTPAARCFDCGYPVEQSTSGMTSTTEGGAVAPSRQNNRAGVSQVITEITEHLR